jgi:hypothetical protein
MNRHWLQDWPWETVVAINAGLCQEKQALHKPTSAGYAPAKKLWETSRGRELTLREVFDLCRQCHQLAPFCFYNGNTFAAIGRLNLMTEDRQRISDDGGRRAEDGHLASDIWL